MTDDPKDDPRRPGRPRADEPRDASLTVWLRASEYDRLVRLASKADGNLSALVRSLLLKPR